MVSSKRCLGIWSANFTKNFLTGGEEKIKLFYSLDLSRQLDLFKDQNISENAKTRRLLTIFWIDWQKRLRDSKVLHFRIKKFQNQNKNVNKDLKIFKKFVSRKFVSKLKSEN